jgi:hypothetical protein
MSYCVHCGVSVEPSERVCPLCGTEILNPRQPFDERARRPYPSRLDPITARINKQFIAAIISIALVFPAALVITIDLIYSDRADWSLVVSGALAMIWCFLCPYFLMKKPSFIKITIPAILSILAFLFLIDRIYLSVNWYLGLALPLVLLVGFLVLLIGQLIAKRILRGFMIPTVILTAIGLLVAGIEIITECYAFGTTQIEWSLFVLIPCFALAGVSLSIARRQSIHEEIRKRLHL